MDKIPRVIITKEENKRSKFKKFKMACIKKIKNIFDLLFII